MTLAIVGGSGKNDLKLIYTKVRVTERESGEEGLGGFSPLSPSSLPQQPLSLQTQCPP